ncbi:hypothetical protein Efla_005601 [Eimeria flavescens]
MFGELAPPAEDYKTVEYTEYKNAQVMSPPDMPDYLLDYILTKANELLDGEGGSDSQVVATALKRDLDERWQPYWHLPVSPHSQNGSLVECSTLMLLGALETVLRALLGSGEEDLVDVTSDRHVTVGKNFASHVVHQKRRFVYFVVGKTAFLVYKAQ